MAMWEPYRWLCVSIVASSLAITAVVDENISSAPRMLARPETSLIIIHLRVFGSQIVDRATSQRWIADSGYFTRNSAT
jgi:hypothetical protein